MARPSVCVWSGMSQVRGYPHWTGLKSAVHVSPLSLSLWTQGKPNSYPTPILLAKELGNHMFLGQTWLIHKKILSQQRRYFTELLDLFHFTPVFTPRLRLYWHNTGICSDSVWCADAYMIGLCTSIKSSLDLFRLLRVSKLSCSNACFCFNPLPLHPCSLFLFPFIQSLQQFGQVTIYQL